MPHAARLSPLSILAMYGDIAAETTLGRSAVEVAISCESAHLRWSPRGQQRMACRQFYDSRPTSNQLALVAIRGFLFWANLHDRSAKRCRTSQKVTGVANYFLLHLLMIRGI
jgi:hypothetical protein